MNRRLDILFLTNGKTPVELDYTQIKKAALVIKATNHPLRYRIMKLLDENKRIHVSQIYAKLRVEQSVASQHLSILRKAGIVATERSGHFIFYSLHYTRIKEIMNIVKALAK